MGVEATTAMSSQENKSTPSFDVLSFRATSTLQTIPNRSSFILETDPTIQGVPNWWDITSTAGHAMTPGEYDIVKLTMRNDKTFVMTDTF